MTPSKVNLSDLSSKTENRQEAGVSSLGANQTPRGPRWIPLAQELSAALFDRLMDCPEKSGNSKPYVVREAEARQTVKWQEFLTYLALQGVDMSIVKHEAVRAINSSSTPGSYFNKPDPSDFAMRYADTVFKCAVDWTCKTLNIIDPRPGLNLAYEVNDGGEKPDPAQQKQEKSTPRP